MYFSAPLFTIKGNLVFMNSLYHKVAVASICTALSFTLGVNKEAKAATFALTATGFNVSGTYQMGGTGIWNDNGNSGLLISTNDRNSTMRAFYEFNIGNLSLAPDTVIRRAFFNVQISDIMNGYKYQFIDIVGYVGNGIPDLSDFEAGQRLALIDIEPISRYPASSINIDVTQLLNQRISNGDAFAGFGIRPSTLTYPEGSARLGNSAELTIETVPEPTTIFGSALALGVGGWLKRKKSSQQSKTTSQL
jgi:hypothetical protein